MVLVSTRRELLTFGTMTWRLARLHEQSHPQVTQTDLMARTLVRISFCAAKPPNPTMILTLREQEVPQPPPYLASSSLLAQFNLQLSRTRRDGAESATLLPLPLPHAAHLQEHTSVSLSP